MQVDRKQTPSDWRKRLVAISAKSSEELRRVPPEVVAKVGYQAPGDPLDYLVCRALRDALATSEAVKKTLFGGLQGSAGVWDLVVRAYEKGSAS